ncbi:unnamed protein product [Enterobius vermicularis]|uniref:Plus3 domain-containing protein n=1 Tax=Enterobius vermicularis TaxID=51028 RepID=A0A0N4UXA0_ENTVE|nr:unnamed protein product [Enterobius vermicularis]
MSKRIASSSGSESGGSDDNNYRVNGKGHSNVDSHNNKASGSDGDNESRKRKGKRDTRPSRTVTLNKKVIESGTSEDDSDSDGGQPSMSRKRKRVKNTKSGRKKTRGGTAGSARESEESDKTEVDEYDDDMFLDEEDRRRLQEMTEKEREAEIFKRVEQREILLARHAIQKKIQLKKGDAEGASKKDRSEKKRKERKGSWERDSVKRKIEESDEADEQAEETVKKDIEIEQKSVAEQTKVKDNASDHEVGFDEYERPSELQRKQKQKSAMADLLNRRKEKREAEQKKKAESRKSALDIDEIFGKDDSDDNEKSSSSSSHSSSRSSSRSSTHSRSRTKSPEKKREVSSVADLQRIGLSRRTLSKIVHTPFFEKTVLGCFVRVGVGNSRDQRATYRVAQIVDVVDTAKIYDLEGTRTNKGFKLKLGKEERIYRLAFLSNSKFTESEVNYWLDAMRSNNLPVLTMDVVEKKEADIEKALNHKFSDEEVNWMIQQKARFVKGPYNFAIEKSNLLKLKLEAEQNGNLEELEHIQHQIDELEAKAAELDRRRTESIRGISWINQRNRQSMKDAILSGKVHMEVSSQDDPFTRKNARMKPVSGKDRSGAHLANPTSVAAIKDSPVNSAGYAPKTQPTVGGSASDPSKSKAPAPASSMGENDLFKAHDFDLDLDIVLPLFISALAPGTTSVASLDADVRNASSSAPALASRSSRPLSIEDYKRRKGLL